MATEKAKKASTSKPKTAKVMDVAKPGKSAPAATSRPVIVGHKPLVQDPMMSENKAPAKTNIKIVDTSADEPNTSHTPTPRLTHNKVIAPLNDLSEASEESEEKEADTSPEAPSSPPLPGAELQTEPEPEPKPPTVPETSVPEETSPPETEASGSTSETMTTSDTSAPAESEEKPAEDISSPDSPPAEESSDSNSESINNAGVVDAVAEQANTKKQKGKEDVEAQKRQAAIDKLIEEKKYFIPTGQVTRRRHTKWAVVLLLVVLLAVAGFLAAVDAGVIDAGFDLPFDFIENK